MMDASVGSGGGGGSTRSRNHPTPTRSSLIDTVYGVLADVGPSELPRQRGVSQNLQTLAGATVANEHPR